MESASSAFNYKQGREIFNAVFSAIRKALPGGIVKRGTTPIVLFEGVTVGAAKAYIHTGTINTHGISEWISDPTLKSYTTGDTNRKSKVTGRIEFCQERFEQKDV